MNLILLDKETTAACWNVEDPRATHVRDILRLEVGESFFVGIENGRIGNAHILDDGPDGMRLEINLQWDPPDPLPLHLLIGLPRPQVARRLLREIPSLGPEQVTIFVAEKSEPSYRQSKLWNTDEWKNLLCEGAGQAFSTHIPAVQHADSLAEAIDALNPNTGKIAFDLYETEGLFNLGAVEKNHPLTLAFGPEGGWTANERDFLRRNLFRLLALGARVMRVETAVIAATSLAASHLGKLEPPLVL